MLDAAQFGEWLGVFVALYFVFVLTLLTPPWALVYLIHHLRRRHHPGSTRSLMDSLTEYFFGFANPVIYMGFILLALLKPLSTLDRAFWNASLFVVLGVWSVRFAGPLIKDAAQKLRVARVTVLVAMTAVAVHLVLGVTHWVRIFLLQPLAPFSLISLLPWLLYLPLYFVPIHLLWWHWRSLSAGHTESFLLAPTTATKLAAVGLITVFAAVCMFSGLTKSDKEARYYVESHAEKIVEAAHNSGLKAETLASVLYTVQTDTAMWEPVLNRLLSHTWLVDDKSHMLLSKSLDFSIGAAQIKPTTALTAIVWQELSRANTGGIRIAHIKEFRDLPSFQSLPTLPCEKALALSMPVNWRSTKKDVVAVLLDDDKSITMAASILALTAIHWETQNPEWSIRGRTDILATLYQLGFEKSQPKANPQANNFGIRAQAASRQPWLVDRFAGRGVSTVPQAACL